MDPEDELQIADWDKGAADSAYRQQASRRPCWSPASRALQALPSHGPVTAARSGSLRRSAQTCCIF